MFIIANPTTVDFSYFFFTFQLNIYTELDKY